ncbi:MAG: sigma-70 family RNA polymerase sigma factor [Akkermansiaceae bacterium]|nr:sigma-70 family RNA polymerase sigma factor [Akkermansiaceae bacterium]
MTDEQTFPETRLTLLQRLPNAEDDGAWRSFVDLYGPVIFGYVLRRGCPRNDAGDLVQEVFAAVARSIRSFDYDPERGRFRSWLFTITQRRLIARSRRAAARPSIHAGDWTLERLAREPDASADPEEQWEHEYRRQLFYRAMPLLKKQLSEQTWRAFQGVVLDETDPAAVAEELGISLGAVYVAKSRVIARLREKIEQLEREWEPGATGRRHP